jgi:23S rRNA pseudouridine1911/1915/1917 synthase
MSQAFVLGQEQARERVDKVLAKLVPEVSRATLQRWIAEGRVLVGGKPCRARDLVGPGSSIQLEAGESLPSAAEPDQGVELDILFEDDSLIVLNKQAGLVVHPARGHWSGTLVNGLLALPGCRSLAADPLDASGSLRPGVVQRLDKDTSGVLVVAKTVRAREGLKAQLSAHSVDRAYLALTRGVPEERTLSTLHARHPKSRLRFTSLTETGKPAVTHLLVRERLAGGKAALVECRLETGRTHQIRVHLAEQARTPILADALYGGQSKDPLLLQVASDLGRQALHAYKLGFMHPEAGQKVSFEVPLPSDMQEALSALRAG